MVPDPRMGSVRLTGLLSERQPQGTSDTLVVVVHGIGGRPASDYCVDAAWAVARRDLDCLRLALRGADRQGEDFYHAGLVEDLVSALGDPTLARYRRVLLVGYSLGGTICLAAAARRLEPRIRAVAAICTPVDLRAGQQAIDEPARWVYRQYILRNLTQIYRAVARRRPASVPTPLARVERAATLREWDSLTVVPRFGFASVEDYYTRASVGSLLARMELPALLVVGGQDPLVPPATILRHARQASAAVETHTIHAGGHVYFPPDLDLGQAGPRGLDGQVMAWLDSRGR